ncbi:Uu.00g050500.m01.CDS01 [Anthostomella pinea]|uniref:Uu.00g050500.m01.CDS01 n=1 Tax=Anthostomella pinea TaxID=933095 RepID=A0AAI8VTU4_9PEZI|nr:Uu.00g050500.m01.CDS01 [Anthostomella pinea]
MAVPKIAIIGAGPAGLTLASILHHNDIPSTIFERDSSSTARSQGGTLDLHANSGQKALAAAGLLDKFRAIVRPEGEAFRLLKKDGTVLLDTDGDDEEAHREEPNANGQDRKLETGKGKGKGLIQGRPEIDRKDLKNMLIASLPADAIRWNKGISSIAPANDQQWTINFLDGTSFSSPYDLIVGADGAWSRVRKQLTDATPFFSGVSALDVWIEDVDAVAPDVAKFVGMGSCFLFAAERALLFQRNGGGRARVYACVRTPVTPHNVITGTEQEQEPPSARDLLGSGLDGSGKEEVDWTDPTTRERFIERNFGEWFEGAKKAVLAMTEGPTLRHLYMLPVGLTWEARPGVTLVGDSAHLMTPFAGVGVNVAMVDALELAEGIVAAGVRDGDGDREGEGEGDGEGKGGAWGERLAEVVRRYERTMFKRSGREAAKTAQAMEIQFREDGGERMMEIISGGHPD